MVFSQVLDSRESGDPDTQRKSEKSFCPYIFELLKSLHIVLKTVLSRFIEKI